MRSDDQPIRPKHEKACSEIEREGGAVYRKARAMYAKHIKHGVYLRPTDKVFTVISLDYEGCKKMLGVGEGSKGHYLSSLDVTEDSVLEAVKGYQAKRDKRDVVQSPVPVKSFTEDLFAIKVIADALKNNLQLPSPAGPLYFVHQEWFFPKEGKKLDLLAIEPAKQRLWVIELKKSENKARNNDSVKKGDAWAQAQAYANILFEESGEFYPYFERLARAMAQAHEVPKLKSVLLDRKVRPCVADWWPGLDFPRLAP